MKVGIIGSSKGNNSLHKINQHNYKKMQSIAKSNVNSDDTLVSGGSSFSDHIAVSLFLQGYVQKLVLYLPCKWVEATCHFDNTTKEGQKLNQLHDDFSKKVGVMSLQNIQMAIDKGAIVHIVEGFHNRNNFIAATIDKLIAFTFEKKMTPGTQYTWNKTQVPKLHFVLGLGVDLY